LILKELAVWGDVALVAPVEPGGVPVWLAWVDPSTLLRARGLRRWCFGSLGRP